MHAKQTHYADTSTASVAATCVLWENWDTSPLSQVPGLARVGTHRASIVPLHYTNRDEADRHESVTEQLVSPTLNGVNPYSGPRNVEWLAHEVLLADNKPRAQTASEFLTKSRHGFSATQLLHLLTESKLVISSRMFDRVFSKVQKILQKDYKLYLPRRIPLLLPTYSKPLLTHVRSSMIKRIESPSLPRPLQRWLILAVSVIPKSTPKVASMVTGQTVTAVKAVLRSSYVNNLVQ